MSSSIDYPPVVTLEEALTIVITERPIICPNSSFREQLVTYEKSLLGKNSLASELEVLDLIHKKSKLYSGDHATETDFDRMPIQALKTLKAESTCWSWSNAFPSGNSEADTVASATLQPDTNYTATSLMEVNHGISASPIFTDEAVGVDGKPPSPDAAEHGTQRRSVLEMREAKKKSFLKRDPKRIVQQAQVKTRVGDEINADEANRENDVPKQPRKTRPSSLREMIKKQRGVAMEVLVLVGGDKQQHDVDNINSFVG